MTELAIEALLRLGKVVLAIVVGLIVWVVLTGPAGVAGSPELGLLCWLSGAAFVLLIESSPI